MEVTAGRVARCSATGRGVVAVRTAGHPCAESGGRREKSGQVGVGEQR